MKTIRQWAAAGIAGALLSACGGGDPTVAGSGSPSGAPTSKGTFTAVVSFGDSLSDLGAYGGNNDAFVQFSAFTTKATQIQTDAAAGKLTADQANLALFNAQTAAQAEMKLAAQQLVGYVQTQILAKGGKYVAVMNLPDSTKTPFGGTLPASVKPVLTGLVDVFNLWLRDGLTNQPVLLIDANALVADTYANYATYGLTNVTTPACDATKISALTGGKVTDGSSLFCNGTTGSPLNGLTTGASVTTWLFADGVHPTTGGHKLFSDAVLKQLRTAGWIN